MPVSIDFAARATRNASLNDLVKSGKRYAEWFLRGGTMLGALLSSVPLWGGFDPLVVVTRPRRGGERRRIMSKVDAMFDGAHATGYGSGRLRS